MNKLKKYFLKYQEYIGLYLSSIFTSMFGLFLSTFYFGRFFSGIGLVSHINIILSSGIAAIIGGLPVYYINYDSMKKEKNKSIKSLLISQIITFFIFFLLMYFCLFWLIIDFRMDL